ncbi:hypothetical protein [Saccharopolyspora sp. NPDC049426]|uniref:hypothetical protein n=1 Tax=Saccharopolyspora sp. NPDC049426 TaxID=3155652 RepID=UPI003445F438
MAAASGLTLLAAGLLAAQVPPHSVALLALALALLGLGWNFGLVSGTAIITDMLPLAIRAKTQGTADVASALAGAGGGMASGFVVAASSWAPRELRSRLCSKRRVVGVAALVTAVEGAVVAFVERCVVLESFRQVRVCDERSAVPAARASSAVSRVYSSLVMMVPENAERDRTVVPDLVDAFRSSDDLRRVRSLGVKVDFHAPLRSYS